MRACISRFVIGLFLLYFWVCGDEPRHFGGHLDLGLSVVLMWDSANLPLEHTRNIYPDTDTDTDDTSLFLSVWFLFSQDGAGFLASMGRKIVWCLCLERAWVGDHNVRACSFINKEEDTVVASYGKSLDGRSCPLALMLSTPAPAPACSPAGAHSFQGTGGRVSLHLHMQLMVGSNSAFLHMQV